MAVVPEYRRMGIGSKLMAVGVEHADAMNIECWMEASSLGKPLYETFGFRSLIKLAFDLDKKDASDIWRRCQLICKAPQV